MFKQELFRARCVLRRTPKIRLLHSSFQDVQCRYSFTLLAVASSQIILLADLSFVHESPVAGCLAVFVIGQ